MKKIIPFVILALLSLHGCNKTEKGDNDDGVKSISIADPGQLEQKAYADEDVTGEGFTFTAKEGWTTTISEINTRADSNGVNWVWLSMNGLEVSRGDAGTFTLKIELEANGTGKTRSANILIKSGDDSINITVTQGATTQDGKVPDPDKVWNTNLKPKKIVAIESSYDYGDESTDRLITFQYDKNNKISKIRYVDGDAVYPDAEYEWKNNKVTLIGPVGELMSYSVIKIYDGLAVSGYFKLYRDDESSEPISGEYAYGPNGNMLSGVFASEIMGYYKWAQGSISHFDYEADEEMYEYSYAGQCPENNMYIDLFPLVRGDMLYSLDFLDIYGKRSSVLPSGYDTNFDAESYSTATISYVISGGYITGITITKVFFSYGSQYTTTITHKINYED